MDHKKGISNGSGNVAKTESLGVEKVSNGRPWVSSVRKRSSVVSGGRNDGLKRKIDTEDRSGGRKKPKKEVLLASLSSGNKNKSKNKNGAGQGSSVALESRKGVGNGGGSGAGLGGMSLRLNGDVNIPKRPRDFIRRKKVEIDFVVNAEGGSGSRGVFNGNGNGNGNGNVGLRQNGGSDGNVAKNGGSEGVVAKVNRKNKSNDVKGDRASKSELIRNGKGEKGESMIKRIGRSRKVVKGSRSADVGVSKAFIESSRAGVESLDDEENLEANAARMLSSRFDPSCTGFSSGVTSSINKLSGVNSSGSEFDSTRPIRLDESDVACSDGEARGLNSRNPEKGKVPPKKRRYFEVLSQDLDSHWALNRRIKVFWPLDKSWYFGHVSDYDPEKKLHHVKYDDREEEWIDLRTEKFKLLLFPSEVPGKTARKRSATQDRNSGEAKIAKADSKERNSNNQMESEPIISWLGRSHFHKSSPVGIRKKQRTLDNNTSTLASSVVCEKKSEPVEGLEVGPSGQDVDSLVSGTTIVDNPGVSTSEGKLPERKVISKKKKPPIVYFRKRFQKRSQQPSDIIVEDLRHSSKELTLCDIASVTVHADSGDFVVDMLHASKNNHSDRTSCFEEGFVWDIDGSGCLKLIIPVTSLTVFRCQLSLPLPFVDRSLYGVPNFTFMPQHVALNPVWPTIRVEIMFVDNTVGLRFFLFEGCLMQAVSLVFLVLAVFQSNHKEDNVCQQIPATSIRFQFSGLQSPRKQLVFTSYDFTEIGSSKWSYLDRKLSKHCIISQQLAPSACTYNNILALQNRSQLPLAFVSRKPSSVMCVQKRSQLVRISRSFKQSSFAKLGNLHSDVAEKLPSLALSFTAAPTFFISLHLKLLMERSISPSSFQEQDSVCPIDCLEDSERVFADDKLVDEDISMAVCLSPSRALLSSKPDSESCLISDLGDDVLPVDNAGVIAKPSYSSCDLHENELEIPQADKIISPVTEAGDCALPEKQSSYNQLSPVGTDAEFGVPKAKLTIQVPSLPSSDSVVEVQNSHHSADSAVVSSDDAMRSPTPAPESFSHSHRIDDFSPSASSCRSPGWSDRKPDFLSNGFSIGPKKPRTQVSYSTSHGGHYYNSNSKVHRGKSSSHKRIRKANEKRPSEALGTSERHVELLSCDANVLVTVGDRGWRESGAKVSLDIVDENECRLAVKFSGEMKYSCKTQQVLHPGSTNRYTHAMMWKGDKDWVLEFTDRSQWAIFKEILEECYNRNLRAASVKNIPIPGVRLIEENDDNAPEVPYMRPSSRYYRQLETDIDIGMNTSRVLYDMDSDDEQWIVKCRGMDFRESGFGNVSDEMFEKTMDALEKLAYAKQHDKFSLDELEEAMSSFGQLDAILIIYKHWQEKRQRKGMPLIRHLQPPLWEMYQQQVKEWEQVAPTSSTTPFSGSSEKSSIVEKPAMFAFCLKPRGLEVYNRGSKHRPQKRLPVGVLSNGVHGDPESFHPPVGRRLNGVPLGDDRLAVSAYNQGAPDSSPVIQGSTRVFSPRLPGGMGHFSLNNDGFERNYYSKPYKNKSKKLCLMPPSNDQLLSHSPKHMDRRNTGHMSSMGFSEWPSQMIYQPNGFQRHNYDQLDSHELDEFRLRDAASAARHAATVAKMKRENAQRMLCRADLAMHKAVAAIMTAEAVKASYEDPNDDDDQTTG